MDSSGPVKASREQLASFSFLTAEYRIPQSRYEAVTLMGGKKSNRQTGTNFEIWP
jgi:hypothetical protein